MNTKSTGRGKRGPHLVTRAKDTLKACGPLSIEQLAEGLGIDMAKAQTLAKNGVQRGLWKREQLADGEKLVLVGLTPPHGKSGLKRYLTQRGGAAPAKAKKRSREPELPAVPPVVPIDEPEAQFGLYNTGEFRIEFAGQEMKLPRKATREMVAYLLKIDAAFQGGE